MSNGRGGFRIVEINTNRGEEMHWSGSLHTPSTLKKHLLHIEEKFSWQFKGLNALLMRWGLANYFRARKHYRITREHNQSENQKLADQKGE